MHMLVRLQGRAHQGLHETANQGQQGSASACACRSSKVQPSGLAFVKRGICSQQDDRFAAVGSTECKGVRFA